MKKTLVIILGFCIATNALAWLKCEPRYNRFGVYADTCTQMPGPPPKEALEYQGSYEEPGKIKSITKNPDGSISITRTGDKGFYETYRETRPNHWERQ